MIWQDKEPALVRASSRTRRFSTTTLSGRPMSSFGSEQTAFNYQCQGSCADIIASAISMLPESISNMLLFPVHDELVFQVPETDVTAVSDVIRKIMIDAADSLIRGHVPVIVDINVSNAWS